MSVRYEVADEMEYWWCESHHRRATHVCVKLDGSREHCCAPSLGGILLPCSCSLKTVGYLEITYRLKQVDGFWVWISEGGNQRGPKFRFREDAEFWARESCLGHYLKPADAGKET